MRIHDIIFSLYRLQTERRSVFYLNSTRRLTGYLHVYLAKFWGVFASRNFFANFQKSRRRRLHYLRKLITNFAQMQYINIPLILMECDI